MADNQRGTYNTGIAPDIKWGQNNTELTWKLNIKQIEVKDSQGPRSASALQKPCSRNSFLSIQQSWEIVSGPK